jgi:hypothetical protein
VRKTKNNALLDAAQATLTQKIHEAKETEFREFLKNMDYRKDAVEAHRYLSNLCGKGASADDRNAPMVYNNKEATTVAAKANLFC